MNINEVVGLEGAAEITGLTVSTVASYAGHGLYGFPKPVDKLGGYRLWSKKELEAWTANRKKGSA